MNPLALRVRLGSVLIVAGLSLLIGACGAKATEPFRDAGKGQTNDTKADLLTFPDGFSNAATKCDHGNRVYVVFKNDNAYGSIAVVAQDPTCPKT